MNGTKIANFLNEKHIPTGREADWHLSSVARMLADEYVIGKAAVFVHHTSNNPGTKKLTKARPKEEWVYLPEGVVPPILVTEDGKPDIALFERVQQRKSINKENATRNNSNPENYLLRGSYIKCGYCGRNMNAANIGTQGKDRFTYICFSDSNQNNKCSTGLYVRVNANIGDDAAWSKALEIIRDPLEVDRKIEARRTEDPNADRRQHITGELAKIKANQKRLRDRLEDEDLDDDTYADLKLRLQNLAAMKREYEHELSIEIDTHAEWLKVQEQLNHFHKRCQEMREKLDDHNYEPCYDFKRDAVEFFGIIVRVRKPQDPPRITVESSPPSIESNSIDQKRHFPGR
jgi:hypothetical protein